MLKEYHLVIDRSDVWFEAGLELTVERLKGDNKIA